MVVEEKPEVSKSEESLIIYIVHLLSGMGLGFIMATAFLNHIDEPRKAIIAVIAMTGFMLINVISLKLLVKNIRETAKENV